MKIERKFTNQGTPGVAEVRREAWNRYFLRTPWKKRTLLMLTLYLQAPEL